jgi:hypothetical protein
MTESPLTLTDGWPPYVVVSVGRDETSGGAHDHVVEVETRDPDGGETRWSAQQVVAAIRDGEHFVMEANDAAGDAALELQPGGCPVCARTTLVTVAAGGRARAG